MKLTAAEEEIMECIWPLSRKVSSADVMESIGAEKGWKQPTLLTFLTRLCDKGVLESEKLGKLRSYTVLISKEAYKESETRDFITRFHDGSVQNLIACMAGGEGISQDDADALRAWLDKRE